MKQIKLVLLALFSLLTFSGFSQSYDKTTILEVGEWNNYSKEWVWKKEVEIDFTITLTSSKVYISDAANTVISVYGKSTTTNSYNNEGIHYTATSWDAFDEKSRRCTFMMTYYKEKNLIVYSVLYTDVAFRYYCPQKSSFL